MMYITTFTTLKLDSKIVDGNHYNEYIKFLNSLLLREFYFIVLFLKENKIIDTKKIFEIENLERDLGYKVVPMKNNSFIYHLNYKNNYLLPATLKQMKFFDESNYSQNIYNRSFFSIINSRQNHYNRLNYPFYTDYDIDNLVLKFKVLTELYFYIFQDLGIFKAFENMERFVYRSESECKVSHELCLFYFQEILNYAIKNQVKYINFLNLFEYLKEETIENIVFDLEKLT